MFGSQQFFVNSTKRMKNSSILFIIRMSMKTNVCLYIFDLALYGLDPDHSPPAPTPCYKRTPFAIFLKFSQVSLFFGNLTDCEKESIL